MATTLGRSVVKPSLQAKEPVQSKTTPIMFSKTLAGPSIPTIVQQNNASIPKKPKSIEEIFDDIMTSARTESVPQAIEMNLRPVFESTHVILWVYLADQEMLFSPSFSLFAPSTGCLIAAGFKSKLAFSCPEQRAHVLFNAQVDGRVIPPAQPLLMIPLRTRDGRPLGVVQFSRKAEKQFLPNELSIAAHFINKFEIYGKLLFSNIRDVAAAAENTSFGTINEVMQSVVMGLERSFKCRKAEIWKYKKNGDGAWKIDGHNTDKQYVSKEDMGIVGESLTTFRIISERSALSCTARHDVTDGFYDEAIFVYPYLETETNQIWAICLRGRNQPSYFSARDEVMMKAAAPFVLRSLKKAIRPQGIDDHLNDYQTRLTALLEVAEALSGVLDIEELIPLIMKKSCGLLEAERCSLFLVDSVRQELVTRFAGGLSNSIRIPIGKGIVGTVVTTGQMINIPDAYQDPRFDRSIDEKTGFRTVAILALPIFNNRGEIAGVTEMINRIDGGAFDDDDIKLMTGFNVFCGISLDNAKLYSASLNLAKQLRSFVDMSEGFKQKATIRASIEKILDNAREVINAKRATLFLNEEGMDITPLVSVGETSAYGATFAQEAVIKRETVVFTKDQIRDIVKPAEDLQSAIDRLLDNPSELEALAGGTKDTHEPEHSVRGSRVMKLLTSNDHDDIEENQESICAIPLTNSDGRVTGVMELECQRSILSEDVKLLDSLAIFASVTIERNQLKDIATLGQQELEVHGSINRDEMTLVDTIPAKLRLTDKEMNHIQTVLFDSPEWIGIGHIKVCYAVFRIFGLQKKFNISNEKLFRFLTEIRDSYNPVPYHNWQHAVDVTQFITYQIITGKLDKVLTDFELFALLVAAICHDANHDGFTNVYNVKAETPLGILFKNQSVMETHHCAVAISILTKEQCNIFSALEPAEYKKMWTTIVQLILATDMAKHFELLKQFNELYDSSEWSMENPDHRLLLMQLILKTGDISNVSRPFELADRWCDVLCEEFFRQGDLESANGMEYTSPLNDRAHLDKPKSQIGFYTFVCLPLYEAVAKAVPQLSVSVDQVKANLAVWKARS